MTAPLHVETFGSGPDLVLLHGWGMHGGVWGDFALRLAERYRVHVIDLPGHGFSAAFSAPSSHGGQNGRTAVLHGEAARRVPDRDCPACTLGWGRSKPVLNLVEGLVSATLFDSPPPVLPRGGRDAIAETSVLPAGLPPLKKGWDGENKTCLAQTLSIVLEHVPQRAVWLGWSLGGTLAARLAAEHPERVSSLILLACNPCFVRRPDWPWGMEAAVFETFAAEIGNNAAASLRRFGGLLCQGLDDPRFALKTLRERLETRPAPDPHALAVGLDWLRQLDARVVLSRLSCPALLAGGDRDALVPYAALEMLAELNPSFRLARIEGASHVPFLSHEHATLARLRAFLDECPAES